MVYIPFLRKGNWRCSSKQSEDECRIFGSIRVNKFVFIHKYFNKFMLVYLRLYYILLTKTEQCEHIIFQDYYHQNLTG